jgi:heat-inducible transcriptional repressor
VDLDERKAAILRAVVQEYIETAQPVGSGHVATSSGVNVSSATVRNEMSLLEQDGYLHQPHTSAGRVPTEKGYRFFVDTLDAPALKGSNAEQVRLFFRHAHGELEGMLGETSRLLSSLTNCAGVVIGPMSDDAVVRSTQLVSLTGTSALLVVVLSNGTVEKHTIELPVDAGDERVAAASAHLAANLTGNARAVRTPMPATGDAITDAITARADEALAAPRDNDVEQSVFVGGAARMAQSFDAIETVREVLGILEQQFVIVTLLRDVLDRGLQVAIGTETGMQPLSEASLVVAPYIVDGEAKGTIGVLGPTRMNYSQALAAVAVVSNRLGQRLTEG